MLSLFLVLLSNLRSLGVALFIYLVSPIRFIHPSAHHWSVRIGVSPGTSAINLPSLRWYRCNNTCESLGEREMAVWADLYFSQLSCTDKSKLNFHRDEYKACAVQKQHGGWRWEGEGEVLVKCRHPAPVYLIDVIWRCGFWIEGRLIH